MMILIKQFLNGDYQLPSDSPEIRKTTYRWILYMELADAAAERSDMRLYNELAEITWQEVERMRDAQITAKDQAEDRGPVTQPSPLTLEEAPPEWKKLIS